MKIAQNSQAVCAMHRYEKTFIIKIQEKAGYEYEKCNNSRPPVDSAQDLAPPQQEHRNQRIPLPDRGDRNVDGL